MIETLGEIGQLGVKCGRILPLVKWIPPTNLLIYLTTYISDRVVFVIFL